MAGLTVRVAALWNRTSAQGGPLALIVSVTKADGTRVTGLTPDNFSVYVFDHVSSQPPSAVKIAPPSDFGEVADPAGVYGMQTPYPPAGGWSDEELVILVDVQGGGDHGRAMMNPIITKP